MTQQTGIAGVVESPSTEHNAPVRHRWDDLDYVRQVIANGGSYNAMEVLKALESALASKQSVVSYAARYTIVVEDESAQYERKRRRSLLRLVAERKRRREAERTASSCQRTINKLLRNLK